MGSDRCVEFGWEGWSDPKGWDVGGRRLEAFLADMFGTMQAAADCLASRSCRRVTMSMPSSPNLEWPYAEGDEASSSVNPPPISPRDPDEHVPWKREDEAGFR